MKTPDPALLKAKRKALRWMKTIPEVQGVCVGEKHILGRPQGRECVVVFVDSKKPRAGMGRPKFLVPHSVGGVETDVVEIGKIKAQYDSPRSCARARAYAGGHQGRMRPIPCGVSVAHESVTAGTVGLWVKDETDGKVVMLSNAHVLANTNRGVAGDIIYQPGPADGGILQSHRIGRLKRSVRIGEPDFFARLWRFFRTGKWTVANRVDAAVATMTEANPDMRVIDFDHYPKRWADVGVGWAVAKTGRTTGHREGECQYVGATVNVGYDHGVEGFEDQDVFSYMSAGGDSGSAILSPDGRDWFSLLFAGSDKVTIGNPARHVVREMEVRLPD